MLGVVVVVEALTVTGSHLTSVGAVPCSDILSWNGDTSLNCPYRISNNTGFVSLEIVWSRYLCVFPTQGIDIPLNASKDILVRLILGHQARILTERAQKAISQLDTHQIDVLSVDPSTLQPPSTAYSSGNQLNQSTTGSVAVAQTTAAAADIRSRVKKQMDLRKVLASCEITWQSHDTLAYPFPWCITVHEMYECLYINNNFP